MCKSVVCQISLACIPKVQNVKIGPMDLCSLALKKGGGG